ncbi:hypothetical protein D9619_001300 [Psilocybe cf. subviscida]|uniref:ATP-dependent DNA helicase n=1 Tax=Psilocybe cf. subviscida TaxID=2480587 RepID=A0A8H5BFY4_9AGAR|nr:hypothetical protein D9619_001300 [Psilocybe cf. subviscida]
MMTTSGNDDIEFSVLHPRSLVGGSGSMATLELVPAQRLNTYYRFHDVYQLANSSDRLHSLIVNPNVLAVSMTLSDLLNHFRFLSLKDLRRLANLHRVTVWNRNKQQLSVNLSQHPCDDLCRQYGVVIFKELSNPRGDAAPQATLRDRAVGPPDHSAEAPAMVRDSDQAIGAVAPSVDHLRLLTPSEKFHVIQEFEEETSTGRIVMVVCAACGTKLPQDQMTWVGSQEIELTLLCNPHLPSPLRPRHYRWNIFRGAILNFKGLQYPDALGDIRLCLDSCFPALRRGKMPKFALANDLYTARDALPENVKTAFEESTILDRKLICRARCNNICCKFSNDDVAHPSHSSTSTLSRARLGIKGNIMVVPLDAIRMNQVLPPALSSVKDTICAVFVGPCRPSRKDILSSKYSPILVRRSRVKIMLQFLLQMNPFYNTTSSGVTFSEENINAILPQNTDEDVPSTVDIGHIDANDADDISMAEYAPGGDPEEITDNDNAFLMENVGYTNGENGSSNYLAMKALALERCRRGLPFLLAGTRNGLVPDFNNPSLLTWLFPHLDPWGIVGFFHVGRRIRLSMEEQLRHFLLSDDHWFQRDPEFAFVFYNVIRKMQVSQSVRFSVSVRTHRRLAAQLISIDPDTLHDLGKKFERNPSYRPSSENERKAYDTMQSIAMVARQIPGSNGYKVLLRNQIRALINYQGTPTLFITLNPSDVDNPIVRLLTGEDIRLEDVERGEDMSSWQRRLLAARHPAECALFFDLMITKFVKIILGFDKVRSRRGIFGFCDAYYGTVEAQGKGTLHCHMLVWLRGHPSPGKLREQMASSDVYRDQVFQWVESVVKCEFPVSGASTAAESMQAQPLQWIKNRDIGNPNPGVIPAPSTQIQGTQTFDDFWESYNSYIHQLLHKYNWHIHGATCWKYLRKGEPRNDKSCRFRMDGTVREHTTLDEETGALLLRRHHPRVASYNDAVAFMLKCNTELKFIGSGRAARDLVFYATDYVTKPSLPVHAGMAALQYAINKIETSTNSGNSGIQTSTGAVITAVNSLMGRHEISHPQVMSYLIGGGDHYKSHKFTVLNWHAISVYVDSQCRRINPPPGDLPNLPTDLPNLDLDVREESVTASSPHMDYIYRNEQPIYDGLCLYDFVSYTVKSSLPSKLRNGGVQIENVPGSFSHWDHPQRATHYIQRRQECHVPVLLGPSLPNPTRSPEVREKWAKDVMVLFKPWRTVNDLLEGHDSWAAAYDSYEMRMPERHQLIIQNMNAFSESVDARGQEPIRSRGGRNGDNGEPETDDGSHYPSHNPLFTPFLDGNYIGDSDGMFSAISDVFMCTENTLANGDVLDNIISQRIGPDVVSGLDKCQGFVLNTLVSGGSDRDQSHARAVMVDDLATIIEQQATMKEKKQNRLIGSQEDTDLQPSSWTHNMRGTVRNRVQQQTVDIIRLPHMRRLGQFMTVAEEDQALKDIVDRVIQEMNLADNAEQLRAFKTVADHVIQGTPEQLLMYVSGVGGTGKSHVIQSIVRLFEALGIEDCLQLAAPTGIAAVLIGGQTLHSLAQFGPKAKGRNIERLIKTWKNKRYLIIDEISMVELLRES